MRLAVALVVVALALAPVAWAAPDGPALRAEYLTSADDLEWLHEQYERISATKSLGVLTEDQVAQMVQEARALAVSVAVSGELREMELADALDALVRAARTDKNQGSAAVVMTQAARDRLGGVAVSASFHRTPLGAAVQALVGAVESDDPAVEVEETSRGVFVVRVHEEEDGEDEDQDGAGKMPKPEDDDGEPSRAREERRPAELAPPAPRGGDGVAPRGYMGVQLAEEQDSTQWGVRLGAVVEDGPAARAGLRAGDLIQTFGGKGMKTSAELLALVQARAAGERVEVTYLRGEDANVKTTTVVLGPRPASR